MGEKDRYAWIDGQMVPIGEAKIGIRTSAVMAGMNVFEGLRGYWSDERQELYIFKLEEHLRRLRQSMKMMRMVLPYGVETIGQACIEVARMNSFREDVHIRPTVYAGEGNAPDRVDCGSFVSAVPMSTGQRLSDGISVNISSWRRISDDTMPPRIKAGANYQNSRLASMQARIDGYDGTIFLNQQGTVAEGPGACVVLVRDGQVITPSVTASILESITRSTLIDLFARELDITVQERPVDRTELYIADEIFFCGTAAEITPIVSVDRMPVGSGERGPITKRLQDVFFRIARGQDDRYAHWLTPVYQRVAAAT